MNNGELLMLNSQSLALNKKGVISFFTCCCSQFKVQSSILFMLFFITSCSAKVIHQDSSSYDLVKEIPIQARLIATDKLQQLYIVTNKNDVIKFSPEGKELFRFTNNTLGELTHIDVTNPFSILLYYPDYLTAYTLDRTLNKTGEFNFLDLNLMDVAAVGLSNDNNVWLYDEVFFKIKKINRSGEVLRESENLTTQFGLQIQPNFILERENILYVNDPTVGVVVFDVYGQYIKTIDLKNLKSFQIIDEKLIYQEEDELKSFHLQSLATQIIELPQVISKNYQVEIRKSKLFVMKKNKVEIYKF